ncbi:MAG TPA: FGGY-family carbohydrate kinase [Albidovulum sp.]|uniref:FGGY-family carbohydrate kinase n=1 Tax=Albidovulum sp. TaxID=1872424 RepID=UPI002C04D648|nr:FGGY-family carbohydrate kinase [Albidovulum sp.]
MTAPRHVAVIDIGKTNAKLALVDTETLSEIAVVTRPNRVLPGPPWPHFDLEGHWAFLIAGFAEFHRAHGIDAISVTTHGASCVLLDAQGNLAAPMLDYEHPGPDRLHAEYDSIRPDFAETGSPRLPMGLNVGAQLFWMFATDPGLKDRTATILTYPQYWGFRLTGVTATDASSLGCHTDLWNPQEGRLSTLADRLEVADRIAPTLPSAAVLGPILPDIAKATGLPEGTPVHCGIHDSNASLLPHVLTRHTPFSVVSTGTWVISMSMGGTPVTLDPARDTLVNVNALGAPVPSARFMGGREFELLLPGERVAPTDGDRTTMLETGVMLLPAIVPDSGPFRGRPARWLPKEPSNGSSARMAAVSYYLALMTAECLRLIGHAGTVVVEGPFARNPDYCEMLAVATGSAVETAAGQTGTSQGAALLAAPEAARVSTTPFAVFPGRTEALTRYAVRWRQSL